MQQVADAGLRHKLSPQLQQTGCSKKQFLPLTRREGGRVPVQKVCKSLHMFKSLHMALAGQGTSTPELLPS
jgi:hypothetical protein